MQNLYPNIRRNLSFHKGTFREGAWNLRGTTKNNITKWF